MTNKYDEMYEVVICRECNKPEYYGAMIWNSGHSYCRKCTYERWAKESNYKWNPSSNDYVYPIYNDGIDYTK